MKDSYILSQSTKWLCGQFDKTREREREKEREREREREREGGEMHLWVGEKGSF